jgi:hypothetical protein
MYVSQRIACNSQTPTEKACGSIWFQQFSSGKKIFKDSSIMGITVHIDNKSRPGTEFYI